MKKLTTLGIAAVLALGTSGIAMAQNAGAGIDAGAGAGAGADIELETDAMDPNANMGVDLTTTGSIQNHGNLVSNIQTASSFDVSSYDGSSEVSCVKTSSLQGNAGGEAQAIGNAATGNPAIATLHTDLQGNADLIADLEAACGVAEFDVNSVVFMETGADGGLVFYYDDDAA